VLDQAVRQGGFAVVNVGNNAEITDLGHRKIPILKVVRLKAVDYWP
jgi:hypothetical protein